MVRNYIRKTEERWSKENLLAALIELKDHKIRIRDATIKYGISRATLYRNLEKFIAGGAKLDAEQFKNCGGNPILTKVEETVLEKTIKDLREQGYEITSMDVKRICFEYCRANMIPNQFNQVKGMASEDWYYGFLKRHPEVAVTRKFGAGGRPRVLAKMEEAKSKMESGSEVIAEAASKQNGKRSASGRRNVRHMPLLNAEAKNEERGSPKLIAPDGMEVAPKKINGAKRLKLDANGNGTGTERMKTWGSRRTRSSAMADDEDNENEDQQHVNDAVVDGNAEREEDHKEGVEVEMDTNDFEAVE